jgi:site-specific DNA-methyltransferase (adenine-specific)
MKNAKRVLRQAEDAASRAETWADLSNALFDPVDGLVTRAFPSRAEREKFVQTEQYRKIRDLLTHAIDTHGLVEGATAKKSGRFVVRLPESLHLALEREAQREGVSLNQLVVAKLATQLDTLAGQPLALILQAFLEVRDGYSADRVIADPETDSRFLRRCRELGLSGTDFDLNWKLFNARKDKLLANLPKTKKYTVSSERRDEFEYASEIAVRHIQHANDFISLDKMICDPDLARSFDAAAQRLAPGFCPLEYRWVALGLRKAHRLTPETKKAKYPEFALLGRTDSIRLSEIPKEEGIYLFQSGEEPVFVGETTDLHHRIERHFESSRSQGLPGWLLDDSKPIHLSINPLPDVSPATRKAMELNVIRTLKPRFNYLDTNRPRKTEAA